MRWRKGHRSANVEDRRFESGGRRMRLPIPRTRRGGAQMGCGGILLLLVLSMVFKQDFFSLLDAGGGGGGISTPAPREQTAPAPGGVDPEADHVSFVGDVLDRNQDLWHQLLAGKYRDTKLVLFRDAYPSACGMGQAASGPFYCPADEKVYLDLSFYDELSRRFGAPGDFAQAYVLAHEVGHHVQTVLGISRQVRQAQAQNPRQKNQLSVAMELQADCLAGVWARTADEMQLLEPGDVEEGLRAAASVGDDRIQQMSGRGYVNPESFTHGSAQQRAEWFKQGYTTGDPDACDTFG
ncbi:MAG: zinc metallopeptidase [bacterium]|nr:zinc metallopeptidase [bacterium]